MSRSWHGGSSLRYGLILGMGHSAAKTWNRRSGLCSFTDVANGMPVAKICYDAIRKGEESVVAIIRGTVDAGLVWGERAATWFCFSK